MEPRSTAVGSAPPGTVNVATVAPLKPAPSTALLLQLPVPTTAESDPAGRSAALCGVDASWVRVTVTSYAPSSKYVWPPATVKTPLALSYVIVPTVADVPSP